MQSDGSCTSNARDNSVYMKRLFQLAMNRAVHVRSGVVSVVRQPRASSSAAYVDRDINSMAPKHARASLQA